MKARLLPSDSCFCRSRQKTVVLALKNADWLRRKTLPPCSVIKVDKIARVTVNSRSTMTGSVVSTQSNAGKGRVFVTPLSQGIAHSPLVIPQQRSGVYILRLFSHSYSHLRVVHLFTSPYALSNNRRRANLLKRYI